MSDQTNIIASQIAQGVVAVLRHHGLLLDSDLPPGTVRVPIDFTPGVLRGLQRRGFLTSETPDGIIAAVFGMLGAAFEAGIRAKPEPPPAPSPPPAAPPPAPAASPPVVSTAPPPMAAAPPPAAASPKATAPPRRPRAAKASPPAVPAEALPEEETRRKWLARMAMVNAIDGVVG
jgi:hypothetical protein